MSLEKPHPMQVVAEKHFEALQLLWELRLDAVRDSEYLLGDLRQLDQRIENHVDGLVLSREYSLPIIAGGLTGSDRASVFAAVFTYLRILDDSLLEPVFDGLANAEEEALEGFGDGFAYGPITYAEKKLIELLDQESSGIASVAAYALAFHNKLPPSVPRLAEFVTDELDSVRRRGWQIISMHHSQAGN